MIDLKQYEVWFVTGSQHFMARKRWKMLPTTPGRSLLPWEYPSISLCGSFSNRY